MLLFDSRLHINMQIELLVGGGKYDTEEVCETVTREKMYREGERESEQCKRRTQDRFHCILAMKCSSFILVDVLAAITLHNV